MDRIAENLHRTTLWAFLAEAFRRPDQPSSVSTAEASEAARALGIETGELPEGRPDTAQYDHIFGHTVRGPCPCYESEYGEPRRFRFAHEIGDLQGFYRAFGLQPSRRAAERADHVSVECEFLAFLALKEACAAEVHGIDKADLCRDASRKFLGEHLGHFAPALAQRVRRRAQEPFYRSAADLLAAAARRDAQALGVPLGPDDLGLRTDAGTPDDHCVSCGRPDGVPQ